MCATLTFSFSKTSFVFGPTARTILFSTSNRNSSNFPSFFAVSKRRVTAFELLNTD